MTATIVIAVVIIAALVVGWFFITAAARRNVAARHGSVEDAMSDENEPLPSAHLIPDNETAAGDTPEAHDEINPHDLPVDHPGRQAAEAEAEENVAAGGTHETRGDADPARHAGRARGGDDEDLGVARDETVDARAGRDGRFVREDDAQAESARGAGTTRGSRSAS
jgi:hypothetical protein